MTFEGVLLVGFYFWDSIFFMFQLRKIAIMGIPASSSLAYVIQRTRLFSFSSSFFIFLSRF